MTDYRKIADELAWLQAHPEFDERPATLEEFLGAEYLNIDDRVRDSIRDALMDMVGDDVDGVHLTRYALAIFTGAIGIGKTTVASIVLPYLCHWCLCLKDPQGFFDLLPGSRIAFMQMSTSEQQAREVVFGDIDARIKHSPWFEKFPRDPLYKRQIRFPKNIWIIPGDSAETTFEGYNILGGILDEADSHKVTENKDYAEQGFKTIANRVSSRFQQRGFVLIIGQMKSATGFAARKYREFRNRDDAYALRLTIWDSMGDDFYRDPSTGEVPKFAYDTKRKTIIPSGAAGLVQSNESLIWVPTVYLREFENGPEDALKDLAGIPPLVGDPFISLVDRIEECRDRWNERYPLVGSPVDVHGNLTDWIRATDGLPRAAHVDIAYADNGDGMGIALGHVPEMVVRGGEEKPYIVFDLLVRWTAPAGGEIFLSDMRALLYELRDERHFKLKKVTLDGFQSQDTIQQLRKRKIESEYVSIDRQKLPYEDLREAIYERRVDFPQYMVKYRRGDAELVEIAVKELSELVDNGKKIDHPNEGSKDVADAMAGVCFTLMGERTYRRRVRNIDMGSGAQVIPTPTVGGQRGQRDHPAFAGPSGSPLQAPLPPMDAWRPR